MKVYYVTQVLKQGINTKRMCPDYILEFSEITFIASLSRHMDQDRNCHRNLSMFNYIYIYISSLLPPWLL